MLSLIGIFTWNISIFGKVLMLPDLGIIEKYRSLSDGWQFILLVVGILSAGFFLNELFHDYVALPRINREQATWISDHTDLHDSINSDIAGLDSRVSDVVETTNSLKQRVDSLYIIFGSIQQDVSQINQKFDRVLCRNSDRTTLEFERCLQEMNDMQGFSDNSR